MRWDESREAGIVVLRNNQRTTDSCTTLARATACGAGSQSRRPLLPLVGISQNVSGAGEGPKVDEVEGSLDDWRTECPVTGVICDAGVFRKRVLDKTCS